MRQLERNLLRGWIESNPVNFNRCPRRDWRTRRYQAAHRRRFGLPLQTKGTNRHKDEDRED